MDDGSPTDIRTFYWIVSIDSPTINDFEPNVQRGIPSQLVNEDLRHLRIGISGGLNGSLHHLRPSEALDLARQAAGDLDVRIGGGSTTVRDFLAADLIDALHVVRVPILLGRGVRLWDGLEGIEEHYDVESLSSPSGVTHIKFTRR